MKKFRLLSLVAITSIALAQAGWAAGHGGGGGGHGGGSGGFHGGGGPQGGRFGGGTFHGGGFRGGRFNHRFSNNVFIGDFGYPWWWAYPYGYYGYGYDGYPYDYYPYGGPGYGHRYGSRTYLRGHVSHSGRAVPRQQESRRHVSR